MLGAPLRLTSAPATTGSRASAASSYRKSGQRSSAHRRRGKSFRVNAITNFHRPQPAVDRSRRKCFRTRSAAIAATVLATTRSPGAGPFALQPAIGFGPVRGLPEPSAANPGTSAFVIPNAPLPASALRRTEASAESAPTLAQGRTAMTSGPATGRIVVAEAIVILGADWSRLGRSGCRPTSRQLDGATERKAVVPRRDRLCPRWAGTRASPLGGVATAFC